MPLNPKLPDKLDSGPGFLKRVVNSIRAFAIENRITSVTVREKVGDEQVSGQLEAFANGSGVGLKLIVGGGSSNFDYPFKLTDASTVADGPQVRVRFGLVTDFINTRAPDDMAAGDDPPFIVGISNGDHVYIIVVYDSDILSGTYGQFTGLTIGTGFLPSPDSTHQYIDLGTVVAVTGAAPSATPTQTAGGSFGFQLCGSVALYWTLGPTLA